MKIFKDPEGKFSMMIRSEWKYVDKNETSKKNLHQFEISPGEIFQISVSDLNDRISEIIAAKNIVPHDFSLPEISYVEDYALHPPKEMYHWMALIGDRFVLAAYFFDVELKERKNLGLELYEIRFGLRNIVIHQNAKKENSCPGFIPKDDIRDYLDINSWRDRPQKYFENIGSKNKFETNNLSPVKIDPINLYALLTVKVSHQPNGFFDLVKVGQPLDNTIWWDFVLECDKGFIQIWRTPFILEANYYFDGEFDIESFFNDNIKRYKNLVDEKIKTFERHTIYINHYQSYSGCVETLWKEIQAIDLTLPVSPKSHLTLDGERENYTKSLEAFLENSVKYHALAKSLVLNAAFKVESFLNLVIRIGSLPELRVYPEVLSKFLKQEFASRVKNLRFYVQILTDDIDMGSSIYRETKELMNLRNKYVHYEEDAIHNRLGEIFYDRDYPLHQIEENRPAVDATIKTYHQPDLDTVRKAYETANKFVDMVQSLFVKEIKGNLEFLIQQNPIGYNETKGIYSAVYSPMSLDFFTGL